MHRLSIEGIIRFFFFFFGFLMSFQLDPPQTDRYPILGSRYSVVI